MKKKLTPVALAVACMGVLALGPATMIAAAKDTILRGRLQFEGGSVKLPRSSFYRVQLADISRADAPSVVIDTFRGSADSAISGEPLTFQLVLPEERRVGKENMSLAVSALVNCGWNEADHPGEWIRKNDYLSDMVNFVTLTPGEYEVNDLVIHVRQYK